ncbi:MAG: hypothetical protein II309_04175 [Bacilli bacterium]|nr:hypothetical protein [Bacilli bacterium]
MITFDDLNFSKRFQRKVSFFPTLVHDGVEIAAWTDEGKNLVDIMVEMLLEYEIDLGVLFLENEIKVILVMDDGQVMTYTKDRNLVKEGELEEVITVSGIHKVILAEKYLISGMRIISNRQLEI